MKPRRKFPQSLVLLGIAGMAAGWAFKLNHFQGAEPLFNGGVVLLVVGLVSWAVALIRAR